MTHRFKNRFFVVAICLFLATILSTCSLQDTREASEFREATQIVLDWNRLLLDLEWHTPGYRPPVSARMFAYAEMAAYEASLPAMDGYISMETQFPGYQKPVGSPPDYYLPAALNAAYAQIARAFFHTTSGELKQKIESLELRHVHSIPPSVETLSINASIDFGKKAAVAVWKYSISDTLGHDGFMYNYDKNYALKLKLGCWRPEEERPIPPLLPHWGGVRSFVVNAAEVKIKPPIAFDESAPSTFYSEAMEVFSISNSISSKEQWIAEFWSDDVPGFTISPAGRWISIANQAISTSNLTFPEVIETYLKLAISLSDVAIICWNGKYQYQLERPETFIRRNIRPGWSPLHNSPIFPSYPSGHASLGGAAAEVLTQALGEGFSMTDRTHLGRNEFQGKPRTFKSFYDMASENAYSRLLNGVHFRMDCEEGLRLGKIVGKRIAAISLRKAAAESIRH